MQFRQCLGRGVQLLPLRYLFRKQQLARVAVVCQLASAVCFVLTQVYRPVPWHKQECFTLGARGCFPPCKSAVCSCPRTPQCDLLLGWLLVQAGQGSTGPAGTVVAASFPHRSSRLRVMSVVCSTWTLQALHTDHVCARDAVIWYPGVSTFAIGLVLCSSACPVRRVGVGCGQALGLKVC